MSFVLLTPFATLTSAYNILGAYPIFEMTRKIEIQNELSIDIHVKEELTLNTKVRVMITSELADILGDLGVEVFNADDLDGDEELDNDVEDETEEEEVTPPKRRGRGAVAKVEEDATDEVDEEPRFFVEYDTDVTYSHSNLVLLQETPEWKKFFRNNEEKMTSKLSQLSAALAGLHTIQLAEPLEDPSGMGVSITEQQANYNRQVQLSFQQQNLTHRANINTILKWFETKVFKLDIDEDTDEVIPEIAEVPLAEVNDIFTDSEERKEFMAKLLEEMAGVATYV